MPKVKQFNKNEFIDNFQSGVEVLHAQEGNIVKVGQLAKHLNVSVATLRRYCAGFTGQSPKELIADIIISKAKLFLQQGISPTYVAMILGFDEYKVFVVLFKRYEECSPKKYQEKQIGTIKRTDKQHRSSVIFSLTH